MQLSAFGAKNKMRVYFETGIIYMCDFTKSKMYASKTILFLKKNTENNIHENQLKQRGYFSFRLMLNVIDIR